MLAVFTYLGLNVSKQPVMKKVISESELEHNRKLFSKQETEFSFI